jgi:hypothetical protein
MLNMENRPARWSLTGVVTIEWVDAADPDDPLAPPDFGWLRAGNDRPMGPARLAALLRAVAASIDERDE